MPSLKNLSKRLLRISFVGVLVFLSSLSFGVSPVAAQDTSTTCKCYCSSADTGAIAANGVFTSDTCRQTCETNKKEYLNCFTADQTTPENDGKCWTQSECSSYATDRDGAAITGIWGGQNASCAPTKSNDATGYCYSTTTPINLNVAILGNTTVKGFDEYLALAYQFLLPAMSLIAVVMIMVGGLQYVTAGGSAKRFEKAKRRITNALIGLVLLLSAYTIASLLDPRLVNLQALKTPLIKRSVFIDQNAFCEYLIDKDFEVSPASGTCGQAGVIQNMDHIKDEARNSNWKVGDQCQFSGCSTGKSCVTGSDGKGQCVACADITGLASLASYIVAHPELPAIAPSEATCSQAGQSADTADQNDKHKYYCVYEAAGVSTCVSAGMSVDEPFIDCGRLEPESSGDPCTAYKSVQVLHRQEFTDIATGVGSMTTSDPAFAEKICEDDICGFARSSGKRCVFTLKTPSNGCAITQ